MKALLRPAFVGVLSIAIAATGLVGSSSVALAVPPPLVPKWSLQLPVYEGADVFLNGTFTGGDGNGPYTVEVYWNGDATGNTSELYSFATLPTRNPCSPDLLQLCWVVRVQKAAPYVNDQPTPISIVVFLDDGSRTNRSVLDPLTISNAAPNFESFGLSATDIEPGQTVTATGQFADSGTNDTHTVRVAWDDGSPVTTMVLPVGARTFTTDAHKYDLVRNYTVSATVTDDAGAWDGRTATLSVHAANQAPTMSIEVTGGPEGGDSTLALTFADPDALDTHTVTIVWGDGVTTNSGDLAADVHTFNPNHVYADTGSYQLVLTLTDSAIPAHLVTDTKTVVVTNVDPVLGSLQLTPSSVVDHQEVTLSGSFTDPGTLDTFTLTVDWGAGALPPQPLGTDRTFSVKHAYDAAGEFTVRATVEDRDGGKSSSSVPIVVLPSNHAPTGLAFGATATGANVVVTGSFVDPDTTDTHTVTVNWGDSAPVTLDLAAGTTEFDASHVYGTSGTYTVTATVTDHPAGATSSPVSHPVVVAIPPSGLAFDVTATGANVVVNGSFTDPDTTDTHTVTVNWGDSAPVLLDLAAGKTDFNMSHVYGASGNYTVTVAVTDQAGGSTGPVSHPVVVAIPPSGLTFDVTATGANVVVTGSFTDPDTTDTHTVTVNWGDASTTQKLELLAGETRFNAPHVYAASNTYSVTATVTDHPADATTGPVSHAVVVTIPPSGLAFDVTATGANVVVNGSFTDPDTTDTHTVRLSWGDASTTQELELLAGETRFNAPHAYLASGTYTVTATVTDHPADATTGPVSHPVVVTVPAETASDLIDQMSSRVRSFDLDGNTERWLLKKLDDLRDSLIYGNGQVCSSTGILSHVLAFAERTVTSDQYATLSALATKLEGAAGCTSQGNQLPKVPKAHTVTTPPTTVAPAPTPKRDTTAKTSESKSTEGRKRR